MSCQQGAVDADPSQLGWQRLVDIAPDLLLHMGDYGYWDGLVPSSDYRGHIGMYVQQTASLPIMRALVESTSSLIQVSDHETTAFNGDNYHDPVTARALEASSG